MKKLYVYCLFVFLQVNVSIVSAGTVGITGAWSFNGYMNMYDPYLESYVGSSAFQGELDFSGGGSYINHVDTFFGEPWSIHAVSIAGNGNGTYSAQMLFDFGTEASSAVEFLWDISYVLDEVDAGMGRILVKSLDGDNDGDPGMLITSGIFSGASIMLDTNPVPVPAAIWLFGSGLLGLIGVAKRKKG